MQSALQHAGEQKQCCCKQLHNALLRHNLQWNTLLRFLAVKLPTRRVNIIAHTCSLSFRNGNIFHSHCGTMKSPLHYLQSMWSLLVLLGDRSFSPLSLPDFTAIKRLQSEQHNHFFVNIKLILRNVPLLFHLQAHPSDGSFSKYTSVLLTAKLFFFLFFTSGWNFTGRNAVSHHAWMIRTPSAWATAKLTVALIIICFGKQDKLNTFDGNAVWGERGSTSSGRAMVSVKNIMWRALITLIEF